MSGSYIGRGDRALRAGRARLRQIDAALDLQPLEKRVLLSAVVSGISEGEPAAIVVPGEIQGTKLIDTDGDGVGDLPQEGVRIYVDLANNGRFDLGVDPFAHTNSAGEYAITDLPPGEGYVVAEEPRTGFAQVAPAAPATHSVDITEGQVVTGVDFINAASGTISGSVWHDVNANRLLDGNEVQLPGFAVQIDLDSDGTIDITMATDTSGDYSFVGLPAGNHTVSVDLASEPNYQATSPILTGSRLVSIGDGQTAADVDFGVRSTLDLSRVEGRKFHDANGNGVLDEGEAGLEGFIIYLDRNGDGLLDPLSEPSAVTDADGNYQIDNIIPGLYFVAEVPRAGYEQTAPSGLGRHIVLLGAGQTATNRDFGNQPLEGGTQTITGVKFIDLNGDGVQDENEPGLAGWRMYLDTDDSGDLSPTDPQTFTAADGSYSFTGLLPDTYTVMEEAVAGWFNTAPGALQLTDSIEDESMVAPVQVVSADLDGDHVLDLAVLADGVVLMFAGNGDGTFAEPVELAGTDGAVGIAAADVSRDGRTDLVIIEGSSVTVLLNLGDGEFDVCEPIGVSESDLLTVTAANVDGQDGVDVIVTDSDGNVIVLLNDGTGELLAQDPIATGGQYLIAAVAVDIDGDGDTDIVLIDETVTEGEGEGDEQITGSLIVLENTGGSFTVADTLPLSEPTTALTAADVNGDGRMDLIAGDGPNIAVLLNDGQGGFASPVSYFVGGAADVTAVDVDGDGDVDLAAVDGANVVVLFNNGSGAFTRRVSVPVGFGAVSIAPGDYDGDGTVDFATADVFDDTISLVLNGQPASIEVDVSGEQSDGEANFGNQPVTLGEIRGTKWRDDDGDGFRDVEEPGLEGFTIFIDLNGNLVHDANEPFAVTDEDGNYVLPNLLPNTYSLVEIEQDGYTRTRPSFSPTLFVTVGSAALVTGADFGNAPHASLAGNKQIDVDGDGEPDRPGEGFVIFVDLDDDGLLTGADLWAETDENGDYLIEGIPFGTYTIIEQAKPGFVPITPTGGETVLSLPPGETVTLDVLNFALPGRIAGTVFNDDEADGSIAGDFAFTGAPILLYIDANDNGMRDDGEATALTDPLGSFIFAGLIPYEDYTVRIDLSQSPTVSQTTPDPSADLALIVEELMPDETRNVGVGVTTAAQIVGVKWHDFNGDGIRNTDEGGAFTEPVLAGFTIFIDENDNGELDDGERWTVTGDDGSYTLIPPFVPGEFTVVELVPEGWMQTAPDEGEGEGEGEGDGATVSVSSESLVAELNFGNLLVDGNGDGIADTEQSHVLTVQAIDAAAPITIVAPEGTTVTGEAIPNPSPADAPGGYAFPFGFVDFTVTGIDPGESILVDLIVHSDLPLDTYFKYAPLPGSQVSRWFEFSYNDATETGATVDGNVITLALTDGARGDADGEADGSISDPGAPTVITGEELTVVLGGEDGAKKLEWMDDDGTMTTIKAKNAVTSVTFFGHGLFDLFDGKTITLHAGELFTVKADIEPTSSKAKLTAKTDKGGDGMTAMHTIESDGDVRIKARTVMVTDRIEADGVLDKLDVYSASGIIEAWAVGKLRTMQDMSADMLLTGAPGRTTLLDKAKIGRDLVGGLWRIFGGAGKVKVNEVIRDATIRADSDIAGVRAMSMDGARVYAGVEVDVDGVPEDFTDFSATAMLGKVRLKDMFRDSILGARTVAGAKLGMVELNNAGEPFGIGASSLGDIRATDAATGESIRIGATDDAAELAGILGGLGIDLEDFTLRIV